MTSHRIYRLQSEIKNPILIKKKENLLYLTGHVFDYRAEEYLLIKPSPRPSPKGRGGQDLVVGFGSGLEKITWAKRADRFKNIGKYIARNQTLELFGEFTYAEVKYLRVKNPGLRIKINVKHSPVDYQRMIKSSEEIKLVGKSMSIVAKVFEIVKKQLRKKSWTEEGLAKFIMERGYKFGAQDISFPAIVASGPNAAIPHHIPSNKRLKVGESIIIDFGFKYKNYCSDFTRTVFLKRVPPRLEKAYKQVEKAYNECLSLRVHPKQSDVLRHPERSEGSVYRLPRPSAALGARNDKVLTGNDLYQKAVDVLKEKHLDKYFIHSLGHGTGLEIHELPNLSPNSKDILKENMVFSIEPGVYIPKLGGIRIEDLVYLGKEGVKKFINVPTDIKENIIV